MSTALLALLVAGATGVWIYTKLNERTGYGNSSSAIRGAAVSALIIFIVVFSLAHLLLRK